MCGTTSRSTPSVPARATGTSTLRPATGTDRIGDAHRHDTEGLLAQAMARGYLTLDEWRARSDQVLTAVTADDLVAVTADLPVDTLRRTDPARQTARATVIRHRMRLQVAGFVGLAVLMVAIWLAVAVPTGAWYPWPIWPILGTGIGLVSHLVPARAALLQT